MDNCPKIIGQMSPIWILFPASVLQFQPVVKKKSIWKDTLF